MKNMINLVTIILSSILVSLFNGCGSAVPAQTKDSSVVAVVVGNHGCSMGLNFSSPQIRDAIYEVAFNYGDIAIINCDGVPSLEGGISCDIQDQYKKAAKSKLQADALAKTNSILSQLSMVKAKEAEVDTLGALNVAVRSISGAPANASRIIIVCDTGLSTTGLLDFSNNLIGAEPEVIADMLAEKHAIPDLRNTTVIWQQLGDCAFPQKELTPAQKYTLEETWKAIVKRGGGTWVSSDMMPNAPISDNTYPTVTPIDFPEEEPIKFDVSVIEEQEDPFESPVFFSEEQVQFKGDSDDYVNPDKAMESIRPIADYMISEPRFSLLLAGTTAGDKDSDYVRNLSYARAAAVRSSLVQMGISEDRITVIGMGNQDPWHIYGVGVEGELAAQNRKVVLLSADSDMAAELSR